MKNADPIITDATAAEAYEAVTALREAAAADPLPEPMVVLTVSAPKHDGSVSDPATVVGNVFADVLGGFTAWDGHGAWKNEHGVIVREPVTVHEGAGSREAVRKAIVVTCIVLAVADEDAAYLRIGSDAYIVSTAANGDEDAAARYERVAREAEAFAAKVLP